MSFSILAPLPHCVGGPQQALSLQSNIPLAIVSSQQSVFDVDSVFYTIFMGMLIVGGVIGNSLTFIVFWKDNIKTSASFRFQHLALVDSAFLLVAVPLGPAYGFVAYTNWLMRFWKIYPYLVAYMVPVAHIAEISSIWVVLLVAVNRYIAVCLPFKALRWCTIAKVKKELAFVLLSVLLYTIPVFAENRVDYVTYDNGTTYEPHVENTKLGKAKLYHVIYYGVLHFVFVAAGPLLILAYVTIRLIQALKARRRKRTEMVSQLQQNDNNVTVVLIIVIVVFFVCQIPACIVFALLGSRTVSRTLCGYNRFYLRPVADTLMILNSAVNFVIYVLFNKRFRHVLARTVGCCSMTEIDGRKLMSTVRSPRMSVVRGVTAGRENDTDSGVEETRL